MLIEVPVMNAQQVLNRSMKTERRGGEEETLTCGTAAVGFAGRSESGGGGAASLQSQREHAHAEIAAGL